jgi:cholestenol Delta-isomerase
MCPHHEQRHASSVSHPYYPASLQLPAYNGRTYTQQDILGVFLVGTLVVGLLGFRWTRQLPNLATRLATVWFLLCGCIHLVVEGYFVYHHASISGQSTFLGELWKEYGLSDSRYMSSDPAVVVIEGITAVLWGPMSFLVAYLTIQQHPLHHVLALIVSMGQLYGDVLYYATTLMEGAPHCRPEPFYFWAYFVFANAFWIVIPAALIWWHGSVMTRAVAAPAPVVRMNTRSTSAATVAVRPATPMRTAPAPNPDSPSVTGSRSSKRLARKAD